MIYLKQRHLNENAGTGGGGSSIEGLISPEDLSGGKKTDPTAEQKVADEAAAKLKLEADEKAKQQANLSAEEKLKLETEAKAKLEADKPKAIELDGKNYQINAEGNAVDETGKVIKTKAEIEAYIAEEAASQDTVVSEIIKKSGYEIKDKDGKPKVYEDTAEGILEYTNDVATLKAQEEAKKYFQARPQVAKFAQFLENGGNEADYFKKQSESWQNVKLDEANEGMLTDAIVAQLMKAGVTKDQAQTTAKLYKDTDQLKSFGKAAYDRLVADEKAEEANNQKAFEAQQVAEAKQVEQTWTTVNNIIKGGKLHSVTIPESEREEFYKFVALSADDNGNSKAFLARQSMTAEQQLELDYLVYKGLDLTKLITAAAKTQNVNTLRMRMKGKQNGAGQGEGNEVKRNPNELDISLDKLNN